MNSRQFIAKQRVKYLWKTLRRSDRFTGVASTQAADIKWDFELAPRV